MKLELDPTKNLHANPNQTTLYPLFRFHLRFQEISPNALIRPVPLLRQSEPSDIISDI